MLTATARPAHVLAHVDPYDLSPRSIDACETLGSELSAFYEGAPLPDETPGRLDFTSAVTAR